MGARQRLAIFAVCAACAGCSSKLAESGQPVPLSVSAVEPAVGNNAQGVRALLRGEFVPVVVLDVSREEGFRVDDQFQVTVGGVRALEVSRRSNGRLSFFIPPGLPLGEHDVEVTNASGRRATLAGAYRATDVAPPILATVEGEGTAADGASVAIGGYTSQLTLTGSNFGTAASAHLAADDDSPAIPLPPNPGATATDTVLPVLLPASAPAGRYAVVVVNPDGQHSRMELGLAVLAPAVLEASVRLPTPTVSTGQVFQALVDIHNAGGSAALDVILVPFVFSGAGGVTLVGQPSPSFADVLPGQTVTFTATVQAVSEGTVTFTARARGQNEYSGTEMLSLATSSALATLQRAATLSGVASLAAGSVNVAQEVELTLTVSNGGQATAAAVAPATPAATGTGAVLLVQGPTPASADIPGGQSATFRYTYRGVTAGDVSFSLAAGGSDANSGASVATGAVGPAALSVTTSAQLSASVGAAPTSVALDQPIAVTVLVQNAGGAAAHSVLPVVTTTGSAAVVRTSTLPTAVSLAGGASHLFSYEYQATTAGTVTFSATTSGVDANSGAALSFGPVSSPEVTALPPAELSILSFVVPAKVNRGQIFQAVMVVKNVGGAAATDVRPTVPTVARTSLANAATASAPNPVSLAPGDSATFTWTYVENGSGVGTLALSAGVTGVDSATAAALSLAPVQTNDILVQLPAQLVIDSLSAPSTLSRGQSFLVTAVVRNQGEAQARSVLPTPAMPTVEAQGGAAASTSSPVEAKDIPGGGTATFQWLFVEGGTASGSLVFSVACTGTDENTGAAIVAPSRSSAAAGVQERAQLQITAVTLPLTIVPGSTFPLAVTVQNLGEATATGVVPSFPVLQAAGGANAGGGTTQSARNLSGGGSTTFTWQYTETGSGGGTLAFTVGATGADANTSDPLTATDVRSNTANVQQPSSLVITAFTAPPRVTRGQPFLVSLTVENRGGGINNVVPMGQPALSSTGGAQATTSTVPGPVNLGANGSHTFVWSYVETGDYDPAPTEPTILTFSVGVTGTDASTGATVSASPVSSNAVLVQAAPDLTVTAIAVPEKVSRGQNFTVSVTVHNAGEATAASVRPSPNPPSVFATGLAAASAAAAAPVDIPGGQSRSLALTFSESGTGPGTLTFTAGAAGTDANSGAPLTASATSSGSVTVQRPPTLVVELLGPISALAGQRFGLRMSVRNDGDLTASSVLPSALAQEPTGTITLSASLSPSAPQDIPAGERREFFWEFATASGDLGSVRFTGSASGQDAASGTPVSASPGTSNVVSVLAPSAGVLTASLRVVPASVFVGGQPTVVLSVTNTGSAEVQNVAPSPLLQKGNGTVVVPPAPAPVPSLASGATATFSFPYLATGAGWLTFHGHATSTSAASVQVSSGALAIGSRQCVTSALTANAGADVSGPCNASQQLGGVPSASGGAGGYAYEWSPAAGLSSSAAPSPTAAPATTTLYRLRVIDAQGCEAFDSVQVGISDQPAASFVITQPRADGRICLGAQLRTQNTSTGATQYQWDFGDGATSTATNGRRTYAAAGTQVVALTARANGCHSEARRLVYVDSLARPVGPLTFTVTPGTVAADGTATAQLTSDAMQDCEGVTLASTPRFTVVADRGTIVASADAAPGAPGLQLDAVNVPGGRGLSFSLRSDRLAGVAHVRADSIQGGQLRGYAAVTFAGTTRLPQVALFAPSGRQGTDPAMLGAELDLPLNAGSATSGTVQVEDLGTGACATGTGPLVPGVVTARGPEGRVVFTPDTGFDVVTRTYRVSLSGLASTAGGQLDGAFNQGSPEPFTWCFGKVADLAAPGASCLSANPATFSPDGDGTQETTAIAVDASDDGPLALVTAVVRDAAGRRVRTLTARRTANGIETLVWDGRDAQGALVENGAYTAIAHAIDAAGNVSAECRAGIAVNGVMNPSEMVPP